MTLSGLCGWLAKRRPKSALDAALDVSFVYPPEVADVADETLARYLAQAEREHPEWRPSAKRYLAILMAESNLADRAAFRREYPTDVASGIPSGRIG